MKNPFIEEQEFLNGKFKLVTEDNEFRMSHWVKGFGIIDSATGNWVLDMERSFNLDKFELINSSVKIVFQVYADRSAQYETEINLFTQTFTFNNQTLSLKEFSNTFKKASKNS